MTGVQGAIILVLLDLVLPVLIFAVLVSGCMERPRRDQAERTFWTLMASVALPIAITAILCGLSSVFTYTMIGVIVAALLCGPWSLIPVFVHLFLVDVLFTDEEWAAYGYLVVMTAFVLGLPFWSGSFILFLHRQVRHPRRVALQSSPEPSIQS